MSIRSLVLAGALAATALATALAPVPALARERTIGQAAEALRDPQLQGSLAAALAALSGALMNIRMAPFAKAMESMEGTMGGDRSDDEPRAAIDPDATLGDMMGPEGRDMPRQMAERVPQMMTGMAGMAGAMEGMLPELERIGKDLQRSLPRR